MGWCRGSQIAEDVWNRVREFIPEDNKEKIAKGIVDYFEDEDADCWELDMNIIKDAGLENMWEDEDE